MTFAFYLGLFTGLLCGFVLGSIWAWHQDDKERERHD
jgi:hypothetical protein